MRYLQPFEQFLYEAIGFRTHMNQEKRNLLISFISLFKDLLNDKAKLDDITRNKLVWNFFSWKKQYKFAGQILKIDNNNPKFTAVGGLFYRLITSYGDYDEIVKQWTSQQYSDVINKFKMYNDPKISTTDDNLYYNLTNGDFDVNKNMSNVPSLYVWGSWVGMQHDLLRISKKAYDKGKITANTYNTNVRISEKENDEMSYSKAMPNIYYSIEKSPENILNFLNNLNRINNDLKELSLSTSSTIMWKTPSTFTDFMSKNDTFKIYYYNKRVLKKIEDCVDTWANTYNIKFSDRTHKLGFDTAVDIAGKSLSYGEILSYVLERMVARHILKNMTLPEDVLLKDIESNLQVLIKRAAEHTLKENFMDTFETYLTNYPGSLFANTK